MRAARFIPPLAWMGVIFWGSTRSLSSEETGSWLLPLLRALLPWADDAQLELIHWTLRKGGHFGEYAILAWLWLRALAPPGRRHLSAFAISVGYAGFDELHQAWTGVRTARLGDVLLDAASAAAALGLLRFGWTATAALLTTILLWIAAAGGTFLLLLALLARAPAGWLWASAPLAWIALWAWRRRPDGPAGRRSR